MANWKVVIYPFDDDASVIAHKVQAEDFESAVFEALERLKKSPSVVDVTAYTVNVFRVEE